LFEDDKQSHGSALKLTIPCLILKMADDNPSTMDSNREARGKEEGRREDEEGKSGTRNEQAGDIFVFSPVRRTNDNNNNNNNNNRRSRIDKPELFDILCGRGKPIQEHPGNIILHQIVDEHCERYHSAPRLRKRGISDEIVQAIKKSERQHEQRQLPGRFIRREQGDRGAYWKEISDDAARDKVSHCFRARRGQHSRIVIEEKTSTSSQLPAAGAVAPVVAIPVVSTGGDNIMNDMEPSPYPYLQQQQQQHHQSQILITSQLQQQGALPVGEGGGYHQQSSAPFQMLVAHYYAYQHGAPLLGVVGLAGPPHGTTTDPAPATLLPLQQEEKQGHHGQHSMCSNDKHQETPQSAEEQASRHHFYQEAPRPSQGGGRESDSKAN
jgi:hypothetical protein